MATRKIPRHEAFGVSYRRVFGAHTFKTMSKPVLELMSQSISIHVQTVF